MTDNTPTDEKIERYIKVSWVMSGLATLSLLIGGAFVKDFSTSQKELAGAVQGLTVEVAVLKTQRQEIVQLRLLVQDLKKELEDVRGEQTRRTRNVYKIESLLKMIDRFEDRLEKLEDKQ